MFSDRGIPDEGVRIIPKKGRSKKIMTLQARNVLPYGIFDQVGLIVDV